jgi:hypothetical protein
VTGLSSGSTAALLFIAAVVALMFTWGPDAEAGTTYIDGDWTWSGEDITLSNGTWWVRGHIRFDDGNLTLDNATLVVDDGVGSYLRADYGTKLVARNSTIRGTTHGVKIYSQSRGEFFDSTLYHDGQTNWDSRLESYIGDLVLVNCSLGNGRNLIYSMGNLKMQGCTLKGFTSMGIYSGFSQYRPDLGNALIEECTFENTGDLNRTGGIVAYGPGDMNSVKRLIVRGCTFKDVARPLVIYDYRDSGTVLIEDNIASGCREGSLMERVGGALTLRNNTWRGISISGSTGICLNVRGFDHPTVQNETVSDVDRAVLVLEGWGNTLQFWDMHITNVTYGYSTVSDMLDIHRSYVRASRYDFDAGAGLIRLFDCDHTYKGSIASEWGGEIIELNRFNITNVTWPDGRPVPPGRVDMVGHDDRSQANMSVPGSGVMIVISWHLSPDGDISYPFVRARYGLKLVDFYSDSMPSRPSRILSLVIIDDWVPQVTIYEPLPGTVVSGDPLHVMGGSIEIGTGVLSVSVRVNDGNWFPARVLEGDMWSISITVPEDGEHLIGALVMDRAGNEGRAFLEVTTDSTPPEIDIEGPYRVTNDRVIEITISTEENATVYVDGVEVPPTGPGMFTYSTELVEGLNLLWVRVFDLVGNEANTSYRVDLDTRPPSIVLLNPHGGSWTSSRSLLVEVATEEDARVHVNERVCEYADGVYSVSVPTNEGRFDVTVRARDPVGNEVNMTFVVFVDEDPPTVYIDSPNDGLLTRMDSVQVIGRVADWGPVSVSINGNDVDLTGSTFNAYAALEEGPNEIMVVACDPAGNEAISIINVIRDTTAPRVSVYLVVGGEEVPSSDKETITNELRVTLVVNVSEVATVFVTGHRTRVIRDGTSIFPIDLVANSRNKISIDTNDMMGNPSVTHSFVIISDTEDPLIRIASPPWGERTSSSTITVTGSTEPDTVLTLNDQVVPVKDDGTFETEIELAIGSNVIQLVSLDDAGNSGEMTVQVERIEKAEPSSSWTHVLLAIVLVVGVAALVVWALNHRVS